MATIAYDEFINAIFVKKMRKHSFLIIENELFGVFSTKIVSINLSLERGMGGAVR
jgi:hypothetical protein